MRFLVLGCNGMAGHMISLYLKERGHDVWGFARSRSPYIDTFVGDAQDTEAVWDLIRKNKYDSVINCIGILNRHAEENKSLAAFVNGFFPHFLAEITSNTDTQIIHMSTDCVFSGKQGNYTEGDFKDGTTFYDRSKALGELEDGKNITLRTSIVGPDINADGIGLLNWFMKQKGQINGYTKSIWTGQSTLQLAKTMEQAALEKAYGLFNMVPDYSISKYDLLQLFNRYLRNNKVKIIPIDGVVSDKSLKRTRFDFECGVPTYEKMISDLAEWIEQHKFIYPHYFA